MAKSKKEIEKELDKYLNENFNNVPHEVNYLDSVVNDYSNEEFFYSEEDN